MEVDGKLWAIVALCLLLGGFGVFMRPKESSIAKDSAIYSWGNLDATRNSPSQQAKDRIESALSNAELLRLNLHQEVVQAGETVVAAQQRSRRALATFAIGQAHAETIEHTISVFLQQQEGEEAEESTRYTFDVWLYLYDDYEWPQRSEWLAHPHIRLFEAPKRLLKPQFGKKFLPPEAVSDYQYLFFWDGDAVLPRHWSPRRYLQLMAQAEVDISQPSLSAESQHSFNFNFEGTLTTTRGSHSLVVPSLSVELGFMVFRVPVWNRIHRAVLQQYEFKYWCFDALPFQCLTSVNASQVAVIRMPITHPHGKHQLGIQNKEGPDPVVQSHIDYEISVARHIVGCSGCCEYVRRRITGGNNNGCFPLSGWDCPSPVDCQ